jgi:hypothetical protein
MFLTGLNSRRRSNTSTSIIESIQSFTITINSGTNSTATLITSVNTDNSVILYNGFTATSTSETAYNKFFPEIVLTNSTTVTANLGSTVDGTVVVKGYVVEFKSSALEQSVQTGRVEIASTTGSATLSSAVDQNNSVILYAGSIQDEATTTGAAKSLSTLHFTANTSIQGTKGANSSSSQIRTRFYVLSFASGIIDKLQAISASNAAQSQDVTLNSSVDTTKSALFFSGILTDSDNLNRRKSAYILDADNVRAVAGATTSTQNFRGYACEFLQGVSLVQHGSITIALDATSNTATLSTPVDTAKSFIIFTGWYHGGNIDNQPNYTYGYVELVNSTTVRAIRGTAANQTLVLYYQVVSCY